MAMYGWRPQLPDHRDYRFTADEMLVPPVVSLRSVCPPVLDQGQLGDCVGNAIANGITFELMRQGLPVYTPSRLFIYWCGRAFEGTVPLDVGMTIRDGFKVIGSKGAPPEALWPYDIAKFRIEPPPSVWGAAWHDKVLQYLAVPQNTLSMQRCLASGYPIVVGFTVYDSFESVAVASNGIVPMPAPTDGMLGGHCVLCVGYDTVTQRFLCMNSWNTTWGDGGYFTIPMRYLCDPGLASDFWTIRLI